MKKKIWLGIGCLFFAAVVIGIVFCIRRPELVAEAFDMLFKNELPY